MKNLLLFLIISSLTRVSAQAVDSLSIKQVDSLIKVFRSLFAKQDFEKALEVIGIAEKIAIEKLGKESATYGVCCFNHGRILKSKADYPQAEKWYIEAKIIQEKALGMNHPNYANTLNSLAVLYKEMGHYEKAELLYLESKNIRAKALGKEHPDYAQSMNNLANLYYVMSQYEKVEPLYLESKDIREKVLGKQHPDYAQSLNNLGNLYCDMGQYEKAEPFYLEANAIREKALGKEHPDYTESLSNLAVLYYEMGKYEKAEPLYLEANAIREKLLGRAHPVYVQGLSNIARLYQSMRNYEKAEAFFLESKAIFEKALGKEHLDYAKCLNNLANLYEDKRQCEKAEPLFLECKAILEKALGKEHPEYARSLSGLANLYVDMNQYEKAEPIYLESIAIFKKALGKEHPEYAKSLNNLATLYSVMGQYEKAEPLFLESKDIRGKALGKEHPDYANSLGNLVQLYERQSRFSESAIFLSELNTLVQARLSKAISFLSEPELESYKSTFQSNGDGLGSYILARLKVNTNEKEVGRTGILPSLEYDYALFYKGFLLTAAAQLNAMAEGSPKSKEISLRLKSYRRQLAAEFAKPIADRKNVAELVEKANTAEKELARSIAGYSEAKRQVKWDEVMSTLRKDEAAIEFVSFKVSFPRWKDSVIYAALILKSGIKQPKFIPLFEEKSLDSLLYSKSERKADYVNSLYTLIDRGAIAIEAPKKTLYEILWKPLEQELTGIKTIYYSPSGLLHRINLDAIPISEIETLADKYQVIELNSTRQLVIPTPLKNVNNEAVLYGGIQFEQDTTLNKNEPLLASRSRGELSFTSTDSTLRGGSWTYLAGTEREVNAITKIMEENGIQAKLKKGYYATEESFKNIGANNSASPRILHIATHGYFFPDVKQKNKESKLNSQSETVFKISEHPMLRSGLILARGNAAWQGKQTLEGKEDGILTAYEISEMNLSNTELVVLSACETGLGDIQGNEGVFGLQRAFKIAGAKYLIMSLWQVPDKQTSLLMTTFYKKWLENKMTIPNAFHAAQKELRDLGLDPYQWAGFVLVE